MPSLLSPKEVAGALGVSETTALRLLRRRELRGVRVGRLWRVRPVDLEAFLARELERWRIAA